jgi:hypothetical protein
MLSVSFYMTWSHLIWKKIHFQTTKEIQFQIYLEQEKPFEKNLSRNQINKEPLIIGNIEVSYPRFSIALLKINDELSSFFKIQKVLVHSLYFL